MLRTEKNNWIPHFGFREEKRGMPLFFLLGDETTQQGFSYWEKNLIEFKLLQERLALFHI